MPPLISIIVPVYKVEKYLSICVDSVISQTYKNWELILVDDGSPDSCPWLCDDYALSDSRVKVIHQENQGQSSARNKGLDLPPHGEYITFLDSDDFWHREYLSTLVELCVKYQADIAQCQYIRGHKSIFPNKKSKEEIWVYDNHSVFIKGAAKIVMWGKIYHSKLFEGIRMPVGLYNEDDWTTWKLYYRANKIISTNRPLYYYTVNPGSTMFLLKKKLDLRYLKAYEERINYFIHTQEVDLEQCSRVQLCKSLILAYSHRQLSKQEREQIKQEFDSNWLKLMNSSYVSRKLKMAFCLFRALPIVTSDICRIVRVIIH